MSRIRGKDTGPERTAATLFAKAGLVAEMQARDLAGRPDFIVRDLRMAIFVDGAFWHGWRFAAWRHKLSEHWEAKIEKNRSRDRRNFRALRRQGWIVVRLWDFQLAQDPEKCLQRIIAAAALARKGLAATVGSPYHARKRS